MARSARRTAVQTSRRAGSGRSMPILQISPTAQLEIRHRVPGKQGQHVVEKGYPGPNLAFSGPIDTKLQIDPGFVGHAVDHRLSNIGAHELDRNLREWLDPGKLLSAQLRVNCSPVSERAN